MQHPENDDYYYRLGRHQAVIELNDGVPKSRPCNISPAQYRDWMQGYSEMSAMYNWRRTPLLDEKVA